MKRRFRQAALAYEIFFMRTVNRAIFGTNFRFTVEKERLAIGVVGR